MSEREALEQIVRVVNVALNFTPLACAFPQIVERANQAHNVALFPCACDLFRSLSRRDSRRFVCVQVALHALPLCHVDACAERLPRNLAISLEQLLKAFAP